MPDPRFSISKRQIQTICGVAVAVLVLALLVISYPWLQLQLANRLIQGGNYAQAEQILQRLVENKPEWTDPRYKLTISQLYLGKGREAATTVISLADTSQLDDLELAIIFMDVAENLVQSGHGEAALELARRVQNQRPQDHMLKQAVVEVGFQIAEYNELPLSLEALNTALSYSEDNWMLNRKAFNLLLTKALEAPPETAEPALDLALDLFPNNIIALTRKASLLGQRKSAKEALDYLAERESDLLDSLNEEYLSTKRFLITRLANTESDADLAKYTLGMSQEMVNELAKQGLAQAWRQGKSGQQYYQLAVSEPEIAYQYGRNLFQMGSWEEAREVFLRLKGYEPNYTDFKAVFAALDSKTQTGVETMQHDSYTPDMAHISPDGTRLAMRRWMNHPPTDELMFSNLVVVNLSDGSSKPLGDAMLFKWSPDGRHLGYLTISPTGLGRLNIYSPADETQYTFPGDYDIIDFNWAGNNLMVQAERNDNIHLIHLVPPGWQVKQELDWDLNSVVNQDYAWVSINNKQLLIHRYQRLPREFSFQREIVSFTDWSPNGRLTVITDESGRGWVYDFENDDLTEIELPGEFAAWGSDQDIFWYMPVWDKLYVLVRLDSSGNIKEYLPYSFTFPHYDLSIAADGSAAILVEEGKIYISRK